MKFMIFMLPFLGRYCISWHLSEGQYPEKRVLHIQDEGGQFYTYFNSSFLLLLLLCHVLLL